MLVPQFWAEGRVQHRQGGKQVTVRRFGWSDTTQAEAQAMADSRAQEALQRLLAGEDLPRREPKRAYNGAQGVPIREEILSRHGETVVTRNSYGARCLNTPNVLFADIDLPDKPPAAFASGAVAIGLLCALGAGWLTHSMTVGIVLTIAAIIGVGPLAASLQRARRRKSDDADTIALARVRAFVAVHPEWNARVYRTPAGLRVLALHQTFDPTDATVAACFRDLGVDKLYALMCFNQACFRARVSPKPWRIGITQHLRPQPGVWPVAPERRATRDLWIEAYETIARAYSSCSFVESLGSGGVHPDAKQVQELHDEFCRATSQLPIA